MAIFVGAQRRAIVDALADRFDAMADGDGGVQVVVLASPPGWGKTRIVQELYERLAASQPDPRYWPPAIEPVAGEGMGAVMQGRKRIYPRQVDVPAGAEMPWMWWGVLCHHRESGEFAQAWTDDATQVWAHAEAILDATPDKAGRAFDATGALVGLAGLAGLAVFAPLGVALTVGGAARTVWANKDLTARFEAWRERRRDRSLDAAAGEQGDRAVEMAEAVAQISRKVPVVLVVDDAHDADETLTGLVAHLVAELPAARVLVVATAWPQALDAEVEERPFARWLATVGSPRVERIDLAPLSTHDLEAIAVDDLITGAVPIGAADVAQVAQMVVGRVDRNPLAVRALLRVEEVQEALAEGELTDHDLAMLPGDLDAIFHAYWKRLPRDVRQVLERAAYLGTTYVPPVVIAAALADGIDAAADAARHSVDPYAWVRPLNDDLHELLHGFVDPLLHERARHEAARLTPDQRERLHQHVVAAAIDAALDADLPDQARAVLWQHHVALAREGLAPADQHAAGSARHLADHAAATYRYPTAIELAMLALGWSERPADHPDNLEVRALLATWLGEAGRPGEAIEVAEPLLEDQRRALGADSPEVRTTRNNLAVWYGEVGRTADAIDALEALAEDLGGSVGADDPTTLTVRDNLARLYAELGRLDLAIATSEDVLERRGRTLGPDHPATFTTRHNLAHAYGDAGRAHEAHDALEALLQDRLRVLGPDDPATFTTRHNLAIASSAIGRTAEAIDALEALLGDQIRTFGPDHPATLTTRHNLAMLYGNIGRTHDAIAELEAVLADRARVLGPDHPDTLSTRNNLGYQLALAGRVGDAASMFEVLVDDARRVLGPDHPLALSARNNLASRYYDLGRTSEALELLEALLDDERRVLGPDHPTTLSTRGDLAHCYGGVGRIDDALAEFQSVLLDQLRVLGPDHPATLTTRNNLAFWYADAGRADDALAEFQSLLLDQLRVLGEDHPKTLTTRNNIAFCYGQVGQVDDAIDAFRALLEDRVRVLGPTHPETFTTQRNLALWLGEAGHVDEAIAQCEALLDAQLRAFGPDHPETIRTVEELERWRGQAGSAADAPRT